MYRIKEFYTWQAILTDYIYLHSVHICHNTTSLQIIKERKVIVDKNTFIIKYLLPLPKDTDLIIQRALNNYTFN